MSTRKITIKVTEKDLSDVLNDLKVVKSKKNFWRPSEVYLTLDLEDEKMTYEYLTKSKKVLDWSPGEYSEFDDSKFEVPKEEYEHPAARKRREVQKAEEEKIKKDKEIQHVQQDIAPGYDKLTQHIVGLVLKAENEYVGMAMFVYASWQVYKSQPGTIFGTPMYKSFLTNKFEELLGKEKTVEMALLEKVVESYYPGISLADAVLDLEDKMKKKWKLFEQCETLTSVSILLFRNG